VNRGPGGYNQGWNGNRGPGGFNAPRGDYRRWTQDWRRDNRYDWQRFRSSNRMAFHVGRYNPPYRGYAYRRLSVGLFLQPLFYSQSYVIYDPYTYRLPAVYGPINGCVITMTPCWWIHTPAKWWTFSTISSGKKPEWVARDRAGLIPALFCFIIGHHEET
jgi:hypothetical protein